MGIMQRPSDPEEKLKARQRRKIARETYDYLHDEGLFSRREMLVAGSPREVLVAG